MSISSTGIGRRRSGGQSANVQQPLHCTVDDVTNTVTALIAVEVLTTDELAPAVAEHFGCSVALETGPPPDAPGAYVWSAQGRVVYIGSGLPLSRRLAKEQSWIAGHQPDEEWQVTVVHMLKRLDAEVGWLATESSSDALLLERRLIEWHRACVGIAPVVVGWDAKNGSRRASAELWAQSLWLHLRRGAGQ